MRAGIGASTLTTTPSSSATIRGENGGRRQNNLSYVNSCCFIKVGRGIFFPLTFRNIVSFGAQPTACWTMQAEGRERSKKKWSRLYWRKEWCLMHFHCLTPTSQEVNSLPRTSSFFLAPSSCCCHMPNLPVAVGSAAAETMSRYKVTWSAHKKKYQRKTYTSLQHQLRTPRRETSFITLIGSCSDNQCHNVDHFRSWAVWRHQYRKII